MSSPGSASLLSAVMMALQRFIRAMPRRLRRLGEEAPALGQSDGPQTPDEASGVSILRWRSADAS